MSPLARFTRLALPLLAATFAASARAANPTVTVSFEDPDDTTAPLEDQPINQAFKVYLDYSLPLAYYQDVVITLSLPSRLEYPVIEYMSEVSNDSFSFAYASNGRVDTLTWTAAEFDAGVSGRISVTVRFDSRLSWYDQVSSISRLGVTVSGTSAPFAAAIGGVKADVQAGPYVAFANATTVERVVTGTADPRLEYTGVTFYGAHAATVAGVDGMVMRYDYRMIVTGNAGLRGYDWDTGVGGVPWTLALGPSVHLLRAWAGAQSGNPAQAHPPSSAATPSISILSAPIPFGQPGHSAGGTISARVDAQLVPFVASQDYSSDFFVDVFLPCNGTSPLAGSSPADHAANRITMTIGNVLQKVWDDPDVAGTPADIVLSLTPATGLSGIIEMGACGTGGGVTKYWGGTTAANNQIVWDALVYPPIGLPTMEDALVIDKLPPGIDWVRTQTLGYGLYTDFVTWFCVLPGVDFFDVDVFDDFVTSGACAQAVNDAGAAVPPATLGLPTHVVFHAETWGTVEIGAPQKLDLYVTTHVRADYTSAVYGSAHINHVQFQGSSDAPSVGNTLLEEPGPAPFYEVDPWEGYAIRTITDWSCPGISPAGDLPPNRELQPGDCSFLSFRPTARDGLEQPENAVVEIDVPQGVTITKYVPSYFGGEPAPVDGVWAQGGCIGGGGQVIEPAPGDRPLRFELGTTASPCQYAHYYGFDLRLEFCVHEDYPFADGAPLAFDATLIGAANEGTAVQCPPDPSYPLSATIGFTVDVPPEIEYLIYPSCESDGGPAFTAVAANSGGEDLSGITMTLRVPRIADGSGVDAVFTGVDQVSGAPGAIAEVSAGDPPIAWVPVSGMGGAGISNADVRWVRLVNPTPPGITIAALTGPPVSMRMRLQATGPGAALQSAGEAIADQLGVAAPATPPNFILGSCAYLRVHKFLDLDGDGFATGDPGIRDWAFGVENPQGALVGSGVTDGSGDLSFYLPGGVYLVSEGIPAAPPTFAPTTPRGSPSATQSASLVMGAGDVSLSFGNACSCPESDQDRCTRAACELSQLGTGPPVVCGPDGLATCSDDDACSVDSCDPATGACSYASPSCAVVDYFVPVADVSGMIVGNLHCRFADGAAPICDMLAGRLRVYPLGEPGANSCGP